MWFFTLLYFLNTGELSGARHKIIFEVAVTLFAATAFLQLATWESFNVYNGVSLCSLYAIVNFQLTINTEILPIYPYQF